MKAIRIAVQILQTLLLGLLFTWGLCAPLVWILRDGLGPDSVESGWVRGFYRFAVTWGGPALALAVPLLGLKLLGRWLRAGQGT
jgi:hypothetical protein